MNPDAVNPDAANGPDITSRDLLSAWRHARQWASQPAARSLASATGWQHALSLELYSAWYAGCTPPTAMPAPLSAPDLLRGPALVAQLRAAHAATVRFSDGWVVRAIGRAGAAALTRDSELLYRLQPDYLSISGRGAPVRVGDVVSVATRRDEADVSTGWWFTYGRGGVPVNVPTVRLYWNCPATLAPEVVGVLTQLLEACAIPYSLKCPYEAAGYLRTDSFVLYLHREDWGAIRHHLRDAHDRLSAQLRDGHPKLALPLGRGVALAEDPGDGRSFGESRSQSVATGALAAMVLGVDDESKVLAILSQHLRQQNISPARPHLRMTTPEELVPPW